MSSIFGFYYVVGLLRQMGWPKRRGLLNSEAVISSFVLDGTIEQMIDWSASIGACRQNLALQIITTMFRENDWEGENPFSLLKVVNNLSNAWGEGENNNPRDAVKPVKFSKYTNETNLNDLKKDVVSSKDLKNMQNLLEQYFLESLLWGLTHSNNFKIYFEINEKKQRERLPTYKKAGLDIDSLPTLKQTLTDGEEIVRNYEKEVRPLSQAPQKLILDARSLGIELSS